jgi:hypothetical protein
MTFRSVEQDLRCPWGAKRGRLAQERGRHEVQLPGDHLKKQKHFFTCRRKNVK